MTERELVLKSVIWIMGMQLLGLEVQQTLSPNEEAKRVFNEGKVLFNMLIDCLQDKELDD